MQPKTVVLCGSMHFLDQMKKWKARLKPHGHRVLTPVLENFHTIRDEEGDLERFNDIKRKLTKLHFEKVREGDVLLILNYEKNGQEGYIGGNTFAEISYATALNMCHGHNKDIYTVNPIPTNSSHREELLAWGIKQYDGSLEAKL
jgi:hypothetical protein